MVANLMLKQSSAKRKRNDEQGKRIVTTGTLSTNPSAAEPVSKAPVGNCSVDTAAVHVLADDVISNKWWG